MAAARTDSHDRQAARPVAGTLWAWEPGKPHAAALIKVTEVRWNGEEWWVRARILAGSVTAGLAGREYLNDLSRFWEACHYVLRAPGPSRMQNGVVRRGEPQAGELSR